jgi:hypothetical protein
MKVGSGSQGVMQRPRHNYVMYLPEFEVWSHVSVIDPIVTLKQNSMRVCQNWRDTAKSTPQLWTHFQISSCYYPHQFSDPAGLWQRLTKSGRCPLDVILKIPLRFTELRQTLELLHGMLDDW